MSLEQQAGALAASAVHQQYLTFKLGEEHFAAEIGKVREILDVTTITKVPQSCEFLLGVINLRGSVLPVADLRLRLGLSRTALTVNSCIVVTEIEFNQEKVTLGILVDSVQEVFDLAEAGLEPPPRLGLQLDTSFLKGMARQNERFLMVLDVDRLFSSLGGEADEAPAAEEQQAA
jgi:purine-binding chemotaxis protein CheW